MDTGIERLAYRGNMAHDTQVGSRQQGFEYGGAFVEALPSAQGDIQHYSRSERSEESTHHYRETLPSALGRTTEPATASLDHGTHTVLPELLSAFSPIDLGEMKSVALLDQSEVKYVMNLNTLLACLPDLQPAYRVLEVDGKRVNRYRTLYFDTDDFLFYRRHHMGARNRYKVRSREYEDTHLSFFEVKHKTSKRRTVKHRLPTLELMVSPDSESDRFLSEVSPYQTDELAPRSWNRYRRITLVANDTPERVTLDIDLAFYWQNRWAGLPGVVIAEVKQPPHGGRSPFVQLMRSKRFRSSGFSKYCMGVTLLYPDVKQNRFKPVWRRVTRLMEEMNDVQF